MHMNETYMQRCIELAQNGLGNVSPNPMVGAVIVHNGKIIGEGYHQEFGKAHAEVNAINSIKDRNLLKESVLYVNLEPCSHHGKTPPCVDLILQHQIPYVVVGCKDSSSKVNGTGVSKLEQAGVNVELGILEDQCKALNKRFFTFNEKQRPYIILKWAQTTDGYIGKRYERVQITSPESQKLVHKWRSEEQAIMVGTNTALIDDPLLNVRLWKGKSPIRIALDRELKIPSHYHLLDNTERTIIFNNEQTIKVNNTEFIKINFSANILKQVLSTLYSMQIQSVIVEGGSVLLTNLIAEGLWDEARVLTAPLVLSDGVKAPAIGGLTVNEDRIGTEKLVVLQPYLPVFA